MTWIHSTTDESFDDDVFERSKEVPVVVDFWAEWCQPCRMLGPILEKLAEEFAGRFVLVKANTDENSRAAGSFNVQGIPAVYAVVNGEVVDFFAGLLPENQLRGWLDRIAFAGDLRRAQQLEASDAKEAEQRYRHLLEQQPQRAEASIGLARSMLAQGRSEEVKEILTQLEARGFLEPDAQKLKAALELNAKKGTDLDELRRRADAAPKDLNLRLELGEALAAHGEHEAALQTLLDIVAQDKRGVGDKARQIMVDIFRVLPDDSELTPNYRRQLSLLLY